MKITRERSKFLHEDKQSWLATMVIDDSVHRYLREEFFLSPLTLLSTENVRSKLICQSTLVGGNKVKKGCNGVTQ